MKIIIRFLLLTLNLIFLVKFVDCAGTPKFVVPPTSPTRHQLVSGIGIPLNLKDESITYGWTMKAQYFLPETISQLKFQFFPGIFENYTKDFFFDTVWQRFPNGRRRRREILIDKRTGQQYEKYDGEFKEISNEPLNDLHDDYEDDDFDDQFEEDIMENEMIKSKINSQQAPPYLQNDNEVAPDLSSSRWSIYNGFIQVLNQNKLNGRMCLLKAICESTRTQFSHDNLMGELFHIFFTPSTTARTEAIIDANDFDFLKAETIGRDSNDDEICNKVFHDCETSLLDIFTKIFDTY